MKEKTWKSRIGKAIIILLLIDIGFVYLYPIIYMVSTALMPTSDLVNPTVNWVPTYLDFSNFANVFKTLEYPKTFLNTVILAGAASILQTMSCAMAGYALARFRVPFKRFWMAALILVFIVPTSLILVPQYVLFNNYHLIGTLWSVLMPAILGQGLKSSLFVLIFMQSFASYPKAYDEAAQLDGAGLLQVFFKVALPMARGAIVLCLLFSFVWYWNETEKAGMYLNGNFMTLPLQLEQFDALYGSSAAAAGSVMNRLNERVQMAATLLVILPLVLLYLVMQKQFIKSVEEAGITGE